MNSRFFYSVLCLLFLSSVSFGQNDAQTEKATQALTSMHFDAPTFEYGKIEQGEIVQNVFEFTNSGTEPLIIAQAKGSCGCTVPEWPKEPILPGETAQLLVQFNSKGKSGKQSKRVTITANTEPAQTFLTIKGEINSPEGADKEELAKAPVQNKKVDPNSFEVYPNPTTDLIRVSLKEYTGQTAVLTIYSEAGQLMDEQRIESLTGEEVVFDASQYPEGIFTVTMKVGNNMRVAKQVAVTH